MFPLHTEPLPLLLRPVAPLLPVLSIPHNPTCHLVKSFPVCGYNPPTHTEVNHVGQNHRNLLHPRRLAPHTSPPRRPQATITDSEILTIAILAYQEFGGNMRKTLQWSEPCSSFPLCRPRAEEPQAPSSRALFAQFVAALCSRGDFGWVYVEDVFCLRSQSQPTA